MTVHHNRFPVNKTNRCTEFQFYWYYYSTCFGQPFCPSSGVLSHTSALVHFMQLWPFGISSRMALACHPTPDTKWSQLHKMYQSRCMAKNSWRWAERLPETCRVVIPIKLEFIASVGFIHKDYFPSTCFKCSASFWEILMHISANLCTVKFKQCVMKILWKLTWKGIVLCVIYLSYTLSNYYLLLRMHNWWSYIICTSTYVRGLFGK